LTRHVTVTSLGIKDFVTLSADHDFHWSDANPV